MFDELLRKLNESSQALRANHQVVKTHKTETVKFILVSADGQIKIVFIKIEKKENNINNCLYFVSP
jgi:hypothetical protein